MLCYAYCLLNRTYLLADPTHPLAACVTRGSPGPLVCKGPASYPPHPVKARFSRRQHLVPSGIIETVTSTGLEHLAQTAYEAHRGALEESLPAWEDATEEVQKAWRAAVSAIAGQSGVTVADLAAVRTQTIMVQVG